MCRVRSSSLLRIVPALKLPCFLVVFLGVVMCAAPRLAAHGDDHLLIEALTEELAKKPDADLFIRRGELFRHLQEWSKAEADFLAAARLEPTLALVDFFRARAWLEAGAPERARPLIDRYLAKIPGEAEAWFLRGEISVALEKFDAAAADYAAGIQRAASPRPEHFLRRARLLAMNPATDRVVVLAALDEGIARLGPVVALVDFALTLELERKDYAAALLRVAVAMEKAPRRETWLVRRGDILVQCGRAGEAVASYRAALVAIEELPPRYRETVPIEKLARDARTSLGRLASSEVERVAVPAEALREGRVPNALSGLTP